MSVDPERGHSQQAALTEFAVRSDMDRIDGNKEDPENETDNPRMPVSPVLEDELSRSKIRGDGYGVVKPVVPGEREAIAG